MGSSTACSSFIPTSAAVFNPTPSAPALAKVDEYAPLRDRLLRFTLKYMPTTPPRAMRTMMMGRAMRSARVAGAPCVDELGL